MTVLGPTAHIDSRTRLLILGLLVFMLILALSACGGEDSGDGNLGVAPPFELADQFGETYEFTPGDGKNHVFVFYMGYF